MTIYLDKARELGNMIIKSEFSLRKADAQAAFEADKNAVQAMDEYKAYHNNVQQSMESGVLTKEAFAEATKRLTEMATELKSEPVIAELVQAENDFNYFVNQIMNVLKATITGQTDCEGGCDSCAGCGH